LSRVFGVPWVFLWSSWLLNNVSGAVPPLFFPLRLFETIPLTFLSEFFFPFANRFPTSCFGRERRPKPRPMGGLFRFWYFLILGLTPPYLFLTSYSKPFSSPFFPPNCQPLLFLSFPHRAEPVLFLPAVYSEFVFFPGFPPDAFEGSFSGRFVPPLVFLIEVQFPLLVTSFGFGFFSLPPPPPLLLGRTSFFLFVLSLAIFFYSFSTPLDNFDPSPSHLFQFAGFTFLPPPYLGRVTWEPLFFFDLNFFRPPPTFCPRDLFPPFFFHTYFTCVVFLLFSLLFGFLFIVSLVCFFFSHPTEIFPPPPQWSLSRLFLFETTHGPPICPPPLFLRPFVGWSLVRCFHEPY